MDSRQIDPKNFAPVTVALAAVCVVRPAGGAAELRVLDQSGRLPMRSLAAGQEPIALVDEMVNEILSSIPNSLPRVLPSEHKVGFFSARESGGQALQLVYTVGIPWCLESPPSADWVLLPTRRTGSRAAQVRFEIRDQWRQLAEETTAALALLPKFFTIPEMQDVYQAIWDLRKLSNFHRWVQANTGMVTEVSSAQRQRADEELHRVATGRTREVPGLAFLEARGPSASVAVQNSQILSTTIGSALSAAALLGIGTALGYRNLKRKRSPLAKERGREPEYYTAGDLERLEVIYAPRPSWDIPFGERALSLLGGPQNIVGEVAGGHDDGLLLSIKRQDLIDREALAALGVETSTVGDNTLLRFKHREKDFTAELRRALTVGRSR